MPKKINNCFIKTLFIYVFECLITINQRTSGPVNAHRTPGPGIYFNAFIHVYSPRAGADNPLMSTESPYRFAHLLQV